MVGEFVGTVLFLFFAFGKRLAERCIEGSLTRPIGGTQIANNPDNEIDGVTSTSSLLYISLSFGFSLAVNAYGQFGIPAYTV